MKKSCMLLALVLAMSMVLAACCLPTSNVTNETPVVGRVDAETTAPVETTEPAPSLVGAWEGIVDLTEELSAVTGGVDVGEFSMKLVFTFDTNGTTNWSVDMEYMNQQLENIIIKIVDDAMVEVMKEMEMTQEEFSEYLMENQGVDYEMFRQAALESARESMDIESILGGYSDFTGYYKLEDGKLYVGQYQYELDVVEGMDIGVHGDYFMLYPDNKSEYLEGIEILEMNRR